MYSASAPARSGHAPGADPSRRVAELEQLLGRVRLSVAPLVHPLDPVLGRKRRVGQVLALLDDCARQIRGLVAVVAAPEASHDACLAAACRRVQTTVEPLTGDGAEQHPTTATPPAEEAALAHLHSLERALADLTQPPRALSGSPLVGA